MLNRGNVEAGLAACAPCDVTIYSVRNGAIESTMTRHRLTDANPDINAGAVANGSGDSFLVNETARTRH